MYPNHIDQTEPANGTDTEPSWPPVAANRLSAQAQGEPAPPNPLIYLDIWLFGGLILLVMLVVGVKYLWKWLQPDHRDPAEGLQPWEDPDYNYDDEERP